MQAVGERGGRGEGNEGHRYQPPREILAEVGRVLAVAVGAVGDDAAIGEVGKPQPEGHRRQAVDAHEDQDARRPEEFGDREGLQPAAPVDAVFVAQILVFDHRKKRLVAHQRHHPAEGGRLGGADMRVEELERAGIAHHAKQKVHREGEVVEHLVGVKAKLAGAQCRPEPAGCGTGLQDGRDGIPDAVYLLAHIHRHQRQEETLHGPAAQVGGDQRPATRCYRFEQGAPELPVAVLRLLHAAIHQPEIDRRYGQHGQAIDAQRLPEGVVEAAVIFRQ